MPVFTSPNVSEIYCALVSTNTESCTFVSSGDETYFHVGEWYLVYCTDSLELLILQHGKPQLWEVSYAYVK